MGKVIAVCGSPSSGKTVLSLKLAQALYMTKGVKNVLYISYDTTVPSIAYIFPNYKADDMFSLGETMNKTDIAPEDILKAVVSADGMENFGYLGLKAGENKHSYAPPIESKIITLLVKSCAIAEYVIVDCPSDIDDEISRVAKREADHVIEVINPDIKSMAYYTSNTHAFAGVGDRCIYVMNSLDKDLFLPVDDVKAHFGNKNVHFKFPYCHELKEQMITGTLMKPLKDAKYHKMMEELKKAVM